MSRFLARVACFVASCHSAHLPLLGSPCLSVCKHPLSTHYNEQQVLYALITTFPSLPLLQASHPRLLPLPFSPFICPSAFSLFCPLFPFSLFFMFFPRQYSSSICFLFFLLFCLFVFLLFRVCVFFFFFLVQSPSFFVSCVRFRFFLVNVSSFLLLYHSSFLPPILSSYFSVYFIKYHK